MSPYLDEGDDEPYPPEFARKPRSLHVDEGNPACFSCCIMGNPQPEVTWQKDGVPLEDGGRIKVGQGQRYCDPSLPNEA